MFPVKCVKTGIRRERRHEHVTLVTGAAGIIKSDKKILSNV